MTEESKTIRPRHQTVSLIMLMLDVIGLVGLLYCTTVVLSKFRQIFDDLLDGKGLPTLTQVLLSIPAPIYILCIVAAIAGLVCKESRIKDKSQTLIVNVVALITLFVLFVVLLVALFIPLITTIGSLKH